MRYHLIKLCLAACAHSINGALLPLHRSALVEVDGATRALAGRAASFVAYLKEASEELHIANRLNACSCLEEFVLDNLQLHYAHLLVVPRPHFFDFFAHKFVTERFGVAKH